MYKKTYVKLCLLITFLILLVVSVVNVLIDPYGIYGSIDLGFPKHNQSDNTRMAKAHALGRLKPASIAIGTSRTEWGISMQHPLWGDKSEARYNLGLPGGNIYEIKKYIEFSNHIKKLEKVVLGLDFFSFNTLSANKEDFSEERLQGNWSLLVEKISSSISLDTLISSYWSFSSMTIDDPKVKFDKYGQATDESILAISSNPTKHDRLWSNVWRYIKKYYPNAEKKFSLTSSDGSKESIRVFRELVHYCYVNDIDLRIYISPVHALKSQMIKEVGLWGLLEEWKRSLVRVYAEEQREHEDRQNVIWDFSTCSQFNTGPTPNINNKNFEMPYFWNLGHFNKELGNIVLDRLSGSIETVTVFGIPLRTETVEEDLANARKLQEQFEKDNPHGVGELRRFKKFIRDKMFSRARG